MISVPGVDVVWAALPRARVAGGAVRDGLLGRVVADVDFAVPLTPDEVSARLVAAGIRVVPTGLAHGTVSAVVAGRNFEITTLRRDVSTDGRHAVVAFTDDWAVDAGRRDFTINAMFLDRAGVLYDYFGGQADLRAGVVRFVGDATARIAEDYLRILRFFRFFARYAAGAPDAAAVAAITRLRDGILGLSAERIWSELKRILVADGPCEAMALMEMTGVLALIMPEGFDVAALAGVVSRGAPKDVMLRVAALLAGDAGGFAMRLKLSNAELEVLQALKVPNRLGPDADDADLRRALADDAAEILIGRIWLGEDDRPGWAALRARLGAMARPVFALQGRDLAALGIVAGPQMGRILAAVRAWWWERGCVADAAACRTQALVVAQEGVDARLSGHDEGEGETGE